MTGAKVLADSVGPHGIRLTTLEVTMPRPFLAEFNTHRMISRNSASSRAIPTEKLIERVTLAPYVPAFNSRVTGMGVGDPLAPAEQDTAVQVWLQARNDAVKACRQLLHTDKSRANRLLEPFLYQTIIASATDWANFFALRIHPAAQPEFQHAARLMQAAMEHSDPEVLDWGEWHLPLIGLDDTTPVEVPAESLARVSAGRCARVSYDRQHDDETLAQSALRWEQLSQAGHWSPGEHPARVPSEDEWSDRLNWRGGRWGNFRGWIQLRKHYDTEEVFQG